VSHLADLDELAQGDLSGRRLGRYRIRHKLAEGGMADVYLGQILGEKGFERWVAVKVVHPARTQDPQFAHMLADEARLIGRIHHSNVCSVIDFGIDQGLLYLVMEYLHGETLKAAMRRGWSEEGAFPAWLAARAIADAARGLHAAHQLTDREGKSLGLVHRDVSPENILITYDGLSSVIDFGVLRARGRRAKTAAGVVKGKLSHMAPEQLRGDPVDRRADVWSLGVVLWESTLGRRLFRGENQGELVEKVALGPITPPSAITPSYPRELEEIVMSALNRDVSERTPSAKTFAHQLDKYLHGLGRPAGCAEVSRWMQSVFSDRLMVREELLVAPEDSGPLTLGIDDDESSTNASIAGPVGPTSFAPPLPSDRSGLTAVDTPAARAKAQSADPGNEIDSALEELRRKDRQRSAILSVAVFVAIGLALALGFVLLR